MKGLWKVIKWLLWLLAAVIVLFLFNLAYFRMRGPSKAQDAALAKIAEVNERPAVGDNAFALLWLMRYDVAHDQIEAIAADDVRRAQALIASGEDLAELIPTDRLLLPEPSNTDPGLCETRDSGCLARVRANPEMTRELLTRYPRSLQRARNLEKKGSFRNEIPITMVAPLMIPGYAQRLRLSELALAWQDGQRAEAMAGTCSNIASWRQLRHGSNSLIVSMTAVAYAGSAIRLFGDMLAELPLDEFLPADCAAAFASITIEDVSLCAEMAATLLLHVDALGQIGHAKAGKPDTFGKRIAFDGLLPLLFDEKQALGWRAQEISNDYCNHDVIQTALRDQESNRIRISLPMLECASNIIGCTLHDLAAPAYVQYPQRLLDGAAHLRLAATLIWLRETRDDPRSLNERFAARPQALRSGTRATGIADNGTSIWVDNLHPRPEQRFSLPLAAPEETGP